MKQLIVITLIFIRFINVSAQADTFTNTRNIWNVSIRGDKGLLYDYKVEKISTPKYEWEFCEGVWERYEDDQYQVIVDFEANAIYINGITKFPKTGRNGTIIVADSVWQYFAEMEVNLITSESIDSNAKAILNNPSCIYSFQDESTDQSILGESEKITRVHCLQQRLVLNDSEKKDKQNNFFTIENGKLVLNERFKNFEVIENI